MTVTRCTQPERYEIYTSTLSKRLPRFKVDNIIDDGAVDRTEVFDHESAAFPPDARVATRNFCVRIESRQVDFRKDVRKGIGAADEIGVLLNKKRGVQFSRAGHYKFRGRARGQRC